MPVWLVLLCALTIAAPTAAAQTVPGTDGVQLLLTRLEELLRTGDSDGFAPLTDNNTPPEQIEQFTADLFRPDVVRAIVNERERSPLDGAAPGTGYRLVVEMFVESAGRARILTTLLDVRRPVGSDSSAWRITGAQGVTSVEGLYRLRLNSSMRLAARNVTITAVDLLLTLEEGHVYLVESDAGVAGLVLFGRGVMRFTPGPASEQGQLRIFAGDSSLDTQFDAAFIRLHPSQYEQRVTTDRLTPAPPDPRQLRRAQELFERDSPKSFSLDLSGLSDEPWYLLPQPEDFLAEVRTRRYGELTYLRSLSQAEDVTLFERERQRTIALYPSPQRIAALSAIDNDDERRDYDMLDYSIDATVLPLLRNIDGRVRLRLRVQTASISSVMLRLADDLVVTSVTSPEYGRLLHLRIRGQNSVIVSLPVEVSQDSEISLVVSYRGPVTAQEIEDETLQTGEVSVGSDPLMNFEPNLLLSNRSFWYPQNPNADFATATIRITVPDGYSAVASGEPRRETDVTLRDLITLPNGRAFVFTAREPLRYLAFVVSRFVRVAESTIDVTDPKEPGGLRPMRLTIEANPRQQNAGRDLLGDFEAIMRFYAQTLGEAPFRSATVAVVEHELPGGHSPGFFAVLNSPPPGGRLTWRDDPAAFAGFPEYFLSHELAHQWWGQAVGWRNYHEQWLSEGFAQYFAALYARQAHGERVFRDMLRQFNRWAIAESDEGPVSLGYRLGHIRSQPRVFRAVVYNKGAAVLHMLRRLVGDEAFFAALRQFYVEQKFQKANTEALRRTFESVSGRALGQFFDQWIQGTDLPRIKYRRTIEPGSVTVRFEQTTEQLFDLPVTISITQTDGRVREETVILTERITEWKTETRGTARQVQINRDYAAIARFDAD
ncbi:MAG: hypothetical protein HOP16_10675 [Acidobacteria bacterium]|nr:hypothetical protein [Acidobacteriota bacterium]